MAGGLAGDILLFRTNDAMRYQNGKPVRFPPSRIHRRLAISAGETRDGTVWIGSRDNGLYALRDDKAFAPRASRTEK